MGIATHGGFWTWLVGVPAFHGVVGERLFPQAQVELWKIMPVATTAGLVLPLFVRCFFNKYFCRHVKYRNALPDELFYLPEIIFFCRRTKSYGLTRLQRPPSTAYPMNIILSHKRHIKIDHMAHIVHIDTACCDIC